MKRKMRRLTNVKRAIPFFLGSVFIMGITLFLMETAFAIMLNNSTLLIGGLLQSARVYHMEQDRKMMQYLADCARYDNELAYTLKPGSCQVASREFDVGYRINSAGARDEEASLESPQVVVIGDSHAMGWGVAQEHTFPELLENRTGSAKSKRLGGP